MQLFENHYAQTDLDLPEVVLSKLVSRFSDATSHLAYLDVVQYKKDKFTMSPRRFFNFSVLLRSKYLSGYSFTVFDFSYDVSIYPVTLTTDNAIGKECNFGRSDFLDEYVQECNSESDFVEIVSRIFSSEQFTQTVTGLMRIASESREQ